SPRGFPWHRCEWYLDYLAVDRGTPSWLPRDKSEDRRPRSARPRRKIDERQSAQSRPLGHYCPVAIGAVHALPEPWSTRVLDRYLVLAAFDRGRSRQCARRRDPGPRNP